MTPEAIKILVVDDHALVREAFAFMLRTEFPKALVVAAASCAEAMAAARRQAFDVALVDIDLGGRSGLELTTELNTLSDPPAVIAVSMHLEDTFVTRTLQLGARAYVAKDAPSHELFEAIRYTLSGRTYLSKALAEKIRLPDNAEAAESLHKKLSNRELEVLIQLARGKSLKQVAADLSLSAKTVGVHKHNLARKTGLKSTVDIFKYCKAQGLV